MLDNSPLILAIDDSQLILTQLKLLIENQTPCRFIGFDCGFKALESDEIHMASLILLDMNMPSIDGVEMFRKLGELNITQPLALLSGENSLFLKNAASLAQMHGLTIIDSIEKPLSASKLTSLYKILCETSRAQKQDNQTNQYSNEEILIGLQNEEFTGHLQPKVCCKTEKILGVEVLARWQHPTDGIISPFFFIEPLEHLGKTSLLSSQLLLQTVQFWSQNKKAVSRIQFSINISAKELEDVNLPERFYTICSEYGMPTSSITLEVTESNVINDIKHTLDVLLRLKLKGFKLSIDDFGTGYSSMKQLNELPFDELKIDRCFVDGCSQDASKKIIVSSTCEMANKLGLEVVAEGVEELADLNVVRQLGVKSVQGFYYFKPCSQQDFLTVISKNTADINRKIIKSK
ncbi:MAG: diguanylate cyclase [Pseudoalteromonas sp.]|nr:diguanylate cyclase [Pseudoalteromonas sp.]